MTDRPTARDIRRLLPLVRQLLNADGFDARSFGSLELKSVISEVFDGVSDDDDNSRAAYRKLRRTGKGRLRKIDAEALQAPMNPDLLGPRHALAWATLDAQANPNLYQAVRAVRQRFWGASEAPFPAFPGGRKQAEDRAAQWLETQRQHTSPFRRGELRISCSAEHWGEANFAFNEVINAFSDDPDWNVAGQPIAPLLMMLSERLARENVKVEVFRGFPGEGLIEGEFKAVTDFLSILPNKSVPIPPDGPLRELNELVGRVVVASGWWEKDQALHYVMTGYPPTPLINTSNYKTVPPFYYRLPSRSGGSGELKMPLLDIRVEVPISRDEWLELLPEVATSSRRRPKRLTETHIALLQLKAQTPEASWAHRLALWEEWRHKYPEAGLRGFGSERLIRKQWALAGQRVVSWLSASDPWASPKPRSPVR